MTFGEAIAAIGFGATMFAFIVGIFSVWNGRMTRKEVIRAITKMDERADQRHQEMDQRHQEMDERADQRHQEVIKLLEKISELITKGFRDLGH